MLSGNCLVHIVDDEEPVRKSLAFLLNIQGFDVRVHESALAFLKIASDVQNACLVTDLRMPDMDGVELLLRLRESGNQIPAIVITGHGDLAMAVAAITAGALDFIEKPFEAQLLIDSVLRATREIGNAATRDSTEIDQRFATLTEHEHKVLSGVASGLPNKSIGHELNMSPTTVAVHRANIMLKMGARNLAELVRMALTTDNPPVLPRQ